MSDLLTGILSNVTPSLVQGVAGNLGESEIGVTKAIDGMVPTMLAAMIGKSANSGAMNHLFTLLTDPKSCLLYTSPSPRDRTRSRMPSSA